MKKYPIVIGIESSCDDTAISLIKKRNILSNVIINQKIHREYGGVVPELASRLHDKNLPIVFNKAIKYANINIYQIDAVSVTMGPGLIGSLLVGSSFAKSLSIGLNIPLIGINHIKAHVLTHFIKYSNINESYPKFPFLCLVISGGHTLIIQVNDFFCMKILGTTLDDSIGNTFDKVARIFGFQYPGGPIIEKFSKNGNCNNIFNLPTPLVENLNFSFSGIKSYIYQLVKKELKKDSFFLQNNIHDLCASIQQKLTEILLEKVEKAIIKTKIYRVALSGGVSANKKIRNMFINFANKNNWEIFIPKIEFSTDNGAMIAISGVLKYEHKLFDNIDITPYPKLVKELNTSA